MNYNNLVNNLIKQGEFEKELTPQYLSEAAKEPICLIKGALIDGKECTPITSYIVNSQDNLIAENLSTTYRYKISVINLDNNSNLSYDTYIDNNGDLYIRLTDYNFRNEANVFIDAYIIPDK